MSGSPWQAAGASLIVHAAVLAGAYLGSWAWTGDWRLIPPQPGVNSSPGAARPVLEVIAPVAATSPAQFEAAPPDSEPLPATNLPAPIAFDTRATRDQTVHANVAVADLELPPSEMRLAKLDPRHAVQAPETHGGRESNVVLPRTRASARVSTLSASEAARLPTRVAHSSAASAGSSGALSLPSPIYNPRPTYPPSLMAAGIEGLVKLRVELNAQGRVTSAKVAKSSGYEDFDKSAMAIIYRWRFTSSTARTPSQRTLIVPIRFGIVSP